MNRFTKFSQFRGALLCGVAVLALAGAAKVSAAVFPSDIAFAAVTMSPYDMFRLNVSNTEGDGSVRGTLSFVTCDGSVMKAMPFSVAPGATESLEMSFREARPAMKCAQVRPVVMFPPGPCKLTFSLEVVEPFTGATRFVVNALIGLNRLP